MTPPAYSSHELAAPASLSNACPSCPVCKSAAFTATPAESTWAARVPLPRDGDDRQISLSRKAHIILGNGLRHFTLTAEPDQEILGILQILRLHP